MSKKNTVLKIEMEKLLAHPENPNRMSGVNFEKLKNHIKQTGNYEPLIVRAHPEKKGFYQIINGHHRAEALKQLGETFADCAVWDVDDDGVRILLSTLNRLGGKDDLRLKIELIKKLSEKYGSKELAEKLADSKQVIEKLRDITVKSLPLPDGRGSDVFLNTLVFFLNDEQMEIVQAAIEKAMPAKGTKAEKMAAAITAIAQRIK
ncbi:MAG: hypothetical protein A2Y10_02710 [Planctomycetes bacterium GWF2_41_51]|nr:MAG: hypothetical protein A2Y10_02710 [Planctomycetes bacterium GWF2_41_51]HBG27461.1 hypothetical protein [Phycisphaerales bacterium]